MADIRAFEQSRLLWVPDGNPPSPLLGTFSVDGHAIPCVITRAASLIVSGQVDPVIRDDGVG